MIKILNIAIDFLGPITIIILFYMIYYLWAKKAISFSQLLFYAFWPQLVFRFRDFTKIENGKISKIYFLFFGCLTALIISILTVTIPESKDMPIPAIVFVGLALFLMLPIIIYIFVLMSREKYY